ncbi:hypothetical protein CTAYLR_000215 [Chrysophaeum taylorii]|uniref:Calmodulin n=1 Tax=Chrysophaeum taylorii TaxID=2483200 RepID=A0AAD7UE72_9STRA|nr:hypothetical protein CTAYLR_000215 [Chrysophaeum taylorii]
MQDLHLADHHRRPEQREGRHLEARRHEVRRREDHHLLELHQEGRLQGVLHHVARRRVALRPLVRHRGGRHRQAEYRGDHRQEHLEVQSRAFSLELNSHRRSTTTGCTAERTAPEGSSAERSVLPKFGQLNVNVLRGVALKAGQSMYGKADPYVKLTVGTQVFSSNPHAGGGKDPVWNAEHIFEISTEKEMLMEIYDKESVGNDKYMGHARVGIVDWIAAGKFSGDIEITDKSERPVGKVSVSATFSRPGQQQAGALVPAGNETGGEIVAQSSVAESASATTERKQQQPARDPNGKFTDEEIWEAFTAFDLDKNNFVGAAEIRHVLINIGEQVTDDEVDEMIRMIDRDGDGQVSFAEFFEMVTGGRQPPPGLGAGGRMGAPGAASAVPPTGQSVVAARNAKKAALDEFARDSNLKPESIKKAYKRFQATDKDKSGMIDYTEFCEILQVDPSPQGERLFQLFDYDKSGQIDVREFMIALSNFTGAGKDDKLKFAFMIFDEDGNGVITKGELTRILRANHMASSDAEVARKADTIMQQADKDGDGVVTFDEFVIVSKKFPNILFPAYNSSK